LFCFWGIEEACWALSTLNKKNYKITYSHPQPSKKKKKRRMCTKSTPPHTQMPPKINKLKSGDETTF
jgi:hypothetical protein